MHLYRHSVAVASRQDWGGRKAAVEQTAALDNEALLGCVLVGHRLSTPQTFTSSTGTRVEGAIHNNNVTSISTSSYNLLLYIASHT